MAKGEHGPIIVAHARAALEPIGFRRRGQSRIWLVDHGYWLGAVEFQPSGFSRGTYCNVAVHWLWGLTPALTYDFGLHRVGSFARFSEVGSEEPGDVERFTRSVADMARKAAEAAELHRATLPSLHAVATILVQEEDAAAGDGRRAAWGALHAGLASGLIGDKETATRMFQRLLMTTTSDPLYMLELASRARDFMDAASDLAAFRAQVQQLVDTQRAFFKLPAYQIAS